MILAFLFFLVGNAINGCTNVYSALKVQPQRSYWVYSLVLSVLSAFGGGIFVPIFAGKSSFAFHNDFVLFACILVWYFLNYLNGQYLTEIPAIRCVWMFLLGIFRTNSVVTMVNVANGVFSASKCYPTPMFGPIVLGTAVGSCGQFLPFDKGLNPIKQSTIWSIQAAFFSAFFYHCMINDKTGFVGICLRTMIGSYSAATVMMIIATIQIVQLYVQYFLHPDANILSPIHKVLYVIFQVQGPRPAGPEKSDHVGWSMVARERLRHLLDLGRVLLVILALASHIFVMIVPTHLPTSSIASSHFSPLPVRSNTTYGIEAASITLPWQDYRKEILRKSLPLRRSIGLCQWLGGMAMGSAAASNSHKSFCAPYFMKFEKISNSELEDSNEHTVMEYRLAVYEKIIMKMIWDGAVQNISPVHVSSLMHVAVQEQLESYMNTESTRLVLSDNGVLYIVFGPEVSVPASPSVSLYYVPWMKITPYSVAADPGICGQLVPLGSGESGNVVDFGASMEELVTKDRDFANQDDSSNIVTYFTLSSDDGRVVAYCSPTTASKVFTTISSLSDITIALVNAISDWQNSQMNELLPKNDVKTEL